MTDSVYSLFDINSMHPSPTIWCGKFKYIPYNPKRRHYRKRTMTKVCDRWTELYFQSRKCFITYSKVRK